MQQSPTIILGIESSCDDTAAAIIKDGKILANIIANQDVHKAYGGVVPELASRAHQQNIVPVVDAALKKANIDKKDISAIAYTNGPGLLGSLLVGSSFAKAFAMGLNIPTIEVNHMHGHILAHFIEESEGGGNKPSFPFLCLTVSGGHTQIVKVSDYFKMEIIGETIDDAAGEAFDKVAKMLSLPYPGGPLLDKYAQLGNPARFEFPHPRVKDLNYSFSGFKTSVLYFLKKGLAENENFITENLNDICASVQKTIVDILMINLKKAAKQTGINAIAIAGGVSANSELRKRFQDLTAENFKVYIPKFEYCTDNAGMIAITGYHHYLQQNFGTQQSVPNARMKV
ncbi:tRNA (adenosine(37)-N6)-threonylcarbamoyltransferase complex transferase subunit TsaD [Vicingus serpentipes]|uniref:tRNA N6-adenosine threonylcarbamoyltransferase n=1 Tax=Vicingus serpentipes TaxID=1926625 RepID=A0A5C6RX65_9FLAO|nr:tRNA (adenosine(37)-N6)-threonylcarbamoyltransferase complex transferase subunit TsaD [Vicingus serpentipes]TXB66948.1 tRNA (adenosine(37)-N6)-threonylcarbamoyltransferase complex transferase subunit TsaD [Vicingus serpentipes]